MQPAAGLSGGKNGLGNAPGSDARRMVWLRIGLATGLLAGFLLTPRLWLSSRLYPLVPAFAFLRPVPAPWDRAVFTALLLLPVWIAIRPKPWKAIASLLVLTAGYSLFDQARWQPWLYQYLCMLAVIGMSYAKAGSSPWQSPGSTPGGRTLHPVAARFEARDALETC